MLPRRGPSPPRFFRRPSFAGRGLLERTRSTGFALLGISAAMGLGLVALVSQQSWPYLPASPIPEYGAEHGRLDSAIAVGPAPASFAAPAGYGSARKDFPGRGSAPTGTNDSRLSSFDQVPVGASKPTGHQPGGVSTPPPAAEPDPSPPAPPPTPSRAPAPSSPPASAMPPANPPPDPPAVASVVPGKGNAYGRQKAATGKPPHPSPHGSSTSIASSGTDSAAATPETKPPAPAAAGSDGPGNGRGHAYGHDK
jgi:hypothetical protein